MMTSIAYRSYVKSLKPFFKLLFVELLALLVLALIDLTPYWRQLDALSTKLTPSAVLASKNLVKTDLDQIFSCHDLLETSEAKARTCFLDAMPRTKTAMGALAFSDFASVWLMKHPKDEDFRSAALASINQGRTELITERAWRFDPVDQLEEARDRSVVLRLVGEPRSTTTLFNFMSDKLDQAEFGVMLPDVAQKQRQWRLDQALNAQKKQLPNLP